MTPKEKATELVETYKWHEFFDTPLVKNGVIEFLPFSIAKQCALIAVDEIIEAIKKLKFGLVQRGVIETEIKEYEQVKEEIEKL